MEDILSRDSRIREDILSDDKKHSRNLNGDFSLVQSIIKDQTVLLENRFPPKGLREKVLTKYRYIYAHEWDVVPGMSQYGVGDLVLTDGYDNYLVMEVKQLSPFSGRNQSTKRRRARRQVEKQAIKYSIAFRKKHAEAKSIIGVSVADFKWKYFHFKDNLKS